MHQTRSKYSLAKLVLNEQDNAQEYDEFGKFLW